MSSVSCITSREELGCPGITGDADDGANNGRLRKSGVGSTPLHLSPLRLTTLPAISNSPISVTGKAFLSMQEIFCEPATEVEEDGGTLSDVRAHTRRRSASLGSMGCTGRQEGQEGLEGQQKRRGEYSPLLSPSVFHWDGLPPGFHGALPNAASPGPARDGSFFSSKAAADAHALRSELFLELGVSGRSRAMSQLAPSRAPLRSTSSSPTRPGLATPTNSPNVLAGRAFVDAAFVADTKSRQSSTRSRSFHFGEVPRAVPADPNENGKVNPVIAFESFAVEKDAKGKAAKTHAVGTLSSPSSSPSLSVVSLPLPPQSAEVTGVVDGEVRCHKREVEGPYCILESQQLPSAPLPMHHSMAQAYPSMSAYNPVFSPVTTAAYGHLPYDLRPGDWISPPGPVPIGFYHGSYWPQPYTSGLTLV